MVALPELRLRPREDRRLRAGHLWVFSNEVDTARTPLTDFSPGTCATLVDARGRALGVAYVNPASLIAARLVTRDPKGRLDRALLGRRIDEALALRERVHGRDASGRLVFGESDRLPGLVIDRYGPVLVGQITTAGMERCREDLASLLREKLRPDALLWRNDAPLRTLEGLGAEVSVAFGELPERLELREGGLAFSVAARRGQKTGWFFDQRGNRDRLGPYARGARCLDLFSYAGGWGVRAAREGAAAVTCVDSGAQAIADCEVNVRANGVADRVRVIRADAFEFLEQALGAGERYDLVILDPPAFAKRRRDVKAALKAYRRLNELALRLVEAGGFLVTCSCSFHLREDVLADTVRAAGRHVDRQLQRLERLQQAPDHPVHPAIPETDYLKGAIYRVTRN